MCTRASDGVKGCVYRGWGRGCVCWVSGWGGKVCVGGWMCVCVYVCVGDRGECVYVCVCLCVVCIYV